MTLRPNNLRVTNIGCERQDQILFKSLNFELSAGQLIRILGNNGSGKSSLLKIITGILKPFSGEVCWNNQNINHQRLIFSRDLTYIGHKPAVKTELTVTENLFANMGLRGQSIDRITIEQTLELLSLKQYRSVQAGYLSQGQQRRIALCRLWLEKTGLWVLDEPYTSLDKQAVALVNTQINQAVAKGTMVIFTSHQDSDQLDGEVTPISLGT